MILLLIAVAIVIFSRCVNMEAAYKPPTNITTAGYAGSAACVRCHAGISADHKLTAHFRTSAYPGDSTILGSFKKGHNEFRYTDSLYIRMEKKGDSLYQVLYANGEQALTARFDIVVGSGTKGQTYLYWGSDNTMFQLPVSYFTPAHTWSNSPGYPGIPIFDRKVTGRCLECHASFAVQINPDSVHSQPEFDPNQLIMSVGCERCHGPASEHVAWHTAHPSDSTAHAILRIKDFTRKQKLDLCRFCHGGSMPKTRPSFTYMPGEDLGHFFAVDSSTSKTPGIDVHGNQYGLLAASKCFQASDLTCNNCHNSHREERDNVALFASRCQTCHQQGHSVTCALTDKVSPAIMINCVDCHMPRLPSRAITMYLPGENHETAAQMRTHKIAVYPEATDAVLKKAGNGVNESGLHRVFDMRAGKWHYVKSSGE